MVQTMCLSFESLSMSLAWRNPRSQHARPHPPPRSPAAAGAGGALRPDARSLRNIHRYLPHAPLAHRAFALAAPGGILAPFAELRAALGGALAASGHAGVRIAAAIAAAGTAHRRPAAAASLLTVRERQVLGGICEGLSNKEIAARLAISPHTISRHADGLYRKLGVSSRAAAIEEARRGGIAPFPQRREPAAPPSR